MSDLTGTLAAYVADALRRPLPPSAMEATKHHVLDTVAAAVAGSVLPGGMAAARFVREHGRDGDATVVGAGMGRSPEYAALANGMAAHADESDDSHELSKSHPGCSIVPASLATAQVTGASGAAFLHAVALGYDVGPRVNMAAWPSFVDVRTEKRGTPGISGTFGSAAAAAALREFDERAVRLVLSYVAQQVGGMNTWKRDVAHIEKAYVLGGWPAFTAMLAVSFVGAGWSGVTDVFDGDPNFLEIVGKDPQPERLVQGLGTRFEVERTHIKKHAVGSPAQAPIQALSHVIEAHQLGDADIIAVRVTLPAVLAHTVQRSREMSDINLLYLLATVAADGSFSYSAAHDGDRFAKWRAAGGDRRIEVVADEAMEPRRQALVEVETADGRSLSYRVDSVRGSPENPMSRAEVEAKAEALMVPVVGSARARSIVAAVDELESSPDVRRLAELLGPPPD